jgi:glutathione S-transferase
VTHTLYWAPDTGAFVVEAVLEELALPYELVPVDTKRGEHRRPEYLALNPMAQVPVLRLPDGTHLTETAAMVLHLCDGDPETGLLPAPGTTERAVAYRWLLLMATGLYESDLRYYYADRYTAEPAGVAGVKEAARQRLDRLFGIVEDALEPGPYLLGERFSACDLYLFMLALWHPGRIAHLERHPRLLRLARLVRQRPSVGRNWDRNFPPELESPWSTWTG